MVSLIKKTCRTFFTIDFSTSKFLLSISANLHHYYKGITFPCPFMTEPGCQCPINDHFTCGFQCLPVAKKCNNHPDCEDGSDEGNCEPQPT